MTKKELAQQNFRKGYNCSQSIVLAFKDEIGLDETTLLKLSSSFGGGMGRLREVCGAMSGAYMVLGFLYGYTDITTIDDKHKHYIRLQDFAKAFKEARGTYICFDLLGGNASRDPMPTVRTEEYYLTTPCLDLIGQSAEILEQYIKENPIQK